jgi:hypothetical protein
MPKIAVKLSATIFIDEEDEISVPEFIEMLPESTIYMSVDDDIREIEVELTDVTVEECDE